MSDLRTRLKLAAESAKSIAKNALSGDEITVSEDEFDRRMVICRQCPYFKSEMAVCGHCGCFLLVKAKLNGMKCPIGKWVQVEITTDPSDR